MSVPEFTQPQLLPLHSKLMSVARTAPRYYLALLIALPVTPLLALASGSPALQIALCALAVLTTAGLMTWQLLIARAAALRFPVLSPAALGPLITGIGLIAVYGATDLLLHITLQLNTQTIALAAVLVLAGVAKPCSDMLLVARSLADAQRMYGPAGLIELWKYQSAQFPSH